MTVLVELCVLLALGVACAAPVLAMLERLDAHSLTYGLAGFGVGFYALTLLLAPTLMDDPLMLGGYGLMAESVCLLGAAVLALLRRRAAWSSWSWSRSAR